MDAIRALKDKRDTRKYADTPVGDEVLERVCDAARMAGSAKNNQPVRLVIVTDNDAKGILTKSGDFAKWIDQAPVNVVVTVRNDAGPRALFDVGRHAQNLMLAAHVEGLASCPVTIHHPDVAREALGIPAEVDPVMVITLGWPSREQHKSKPENQRITLDDYAHHGSWK